MYSQKGYVIGVTAAKGGLGVSTVALNLVISYHHKTEAKVIAAELRPGQGSWALDLGLPTPTGLTSLLRMNPSEINSTAVSNELIQTTFGVRLLLASNDGKDIDTINAIAQYEAIVQYLVGLSPLVILDIGTSFLPAYDLVTDLCDEIILLVEPQPASVSRTRQLAGELREKRFGSGRPMTVLLYNRTRSDMTMNMSQVEKVLMVNR